MSIVPGGGYAEYVTVNQNHLMDIPDNMSYQIAAAIPEVWLTAYLNLLWVGQVK